MNLKEIQKLLDQRKFKQVIREVDKLKTESDFEKAKAYILRSEAMLALADFNSAYINEALDILRPTANIESFALAKYLKARFDIIDKNLLSAQENLNESYVYYKRIENFRGMAISSNLISYVYYQQSDFISFENNAKRSIDNYFKIGDTYKIFMVNQNMSLMFVRIGAFNKAKIILSEIEEKLKENLSEDNLYNYYHIKSLYYVFTNNYTDAEKTLQKSDKLSKDLKRELFRQYEISALLFLHKGDYKTAEKWGIKGIDLALKLAKESTLVSQIKRIMGDVYLATQRFELAEKITTKALQVAEANNERLEIAACYRILAQIEKQKGNKDKAIDWFKKSIDLFRLINSNYELAVTRYLAAYTDLHSSGEKYSMLYLAKEYFESENITHYVEKVQRELKKFQNATPQRKSSQTNSEFKCPTIITANKKMLNLLEFSKRIAPLADTVLITGATGTGKELIAEHLHYYSGRRGKFITVNTAAIPETMIESELFGYEKGAFTGAVSAKPGKFELAQNGTIFLDEIGDMPLVLQSKLLRVLEERKVERLGGVQKIDLDVRVIAATNKDLDKLSDNIHFRSDLYFRLKVLELNLPSLSERKEDFYPLIEYFITSSDVAINGDAKMVALLAEILSEKTWEGNIRELQNEIRCLLLSTNNSIAQMIELVRPFKSSFEKDDLLSLLEKHEWNKSKVARILDVSEGTVRKRILKYNLDPFAEFLD